MAHWKEHCKDCLEAGLSRDYQVVHQWLDEFAKSYSQWKGHRLHRHHKEGVEEVRAKWGDEAAKAAEIHILKDEGDIPSEEEIHRRYSVDPKKTKPTKEGAE